MGNIDITISQERAQVEKLHQEREKSILEAGKPSLTECSKIATGSAVMEAVLDGRAAIVEHMRDGSKPWEFEKDVWKNVAIRAAIPVPIIGPLVGSIFGMAAYGYAKRGIKARLQSKQRHTLASA